MVGLVGGNNVFFVLVVCLYRPHCEASLDQSYGFRYRVAGGVAIPCHRPRSNNCRNDYRSKQWSYRGHTACKVRAGETLHGNHSHPGRANLPDKRRLEPIGRTFGWCRGPESNWLRPPFQGGALPLSYPGTEQILETRSVRVKLSVEFSYFGQINYSCAPDSSNSRIQFRFLRTSRGLVPSGGPTMPSFSMRSIRRAARP